MAGLDQRDELRFLDEEDLEEKRKERERAQANSGLGFARAKERIARLEERGADKRTLAAAERRLRLAEDRAERSKRVSARETERALEGFGRTQDALQRDAIGQTAPEATDDALVQMFDQVQGFVLNNQPREAYTAALDLLTAAKTLDRQEQGGSLGGLGGQTPSPVGPREKTVISFLFDKDSPAKLPDYLKRDDIAATAPQAITSLSSATPQATASPGQGQLTTAGGRTLSLGQEGQFAGAAPSPSPAIPNAPSIGAAPVEEPFGPPRPQLPGFGPQLDTALGAVGRAAAPAVGAAANLTTPSSLFRGIQALGEFLGSVPQQGAAALEAQGSTVPQLRVLPPPPAAPVSPSASGEAIVEDEQGRRFRFIPDFPGQQPPPNLRVVG